MIGPLELVVRVVDLATRLPMITVGAIYLVTELPTPVAKMTSSVTRPLVLVVVWHLWPSNR